MKTTAEKPKDCLVKSSFSIGALPCRLQIMMPTVEGRSNKRAMLDDDFKRSHCIGNSFREFIIGFLKKLQTLMILEDSKSGIKVEFDLNKQEKQDELRFIIRAGHYGYGSELQNVKKVERIKRREVDDCELLPFCCRMVFSNNEDSAIAVFEKFGVNSAVTIFKDALRYYVRQIAFKGDDYYDVSLMAITNKRYLDQKFKNSVKAIHLVRYADVGDLTDVLRAKNNLDEKFKVQLSISADRGMFLNLLDKFNPFKADDFIGVEIDNKKYTEMRVELKSGKRTQTISFTEDMFAIAFDLTDLVLVDADGHSDPDLFYSNVEDCIKMSKETIHWE